MNKSLFLDTNVIYNLVQESKNSDKLIQIIRQYSFLSVSGLTQIFTYNFCNYTKATNKDYFTAWNKYMSAASVMYLNPKIFENAKSILKGKDFEDAVQVATAIHNKCDCILTSDKEMHENYSNLIEIIFVPKS